MKKILKILYPYVIPISLVIFLLFSFKILKLEYQFAYQSAHVYQNNFSWPKQIFFTELKRFKNKIFDKKHKSNLPKLSFSVASLDTLVGLIAGLITFPIFITFGLSDSIAESSIGALFISIPTGLGNAGLLGRVVAIVFFGLVYIAAITSSVSLLEVPASSLMDKFGFNRNKSVFLVTTFVFVLGIPSALSTNVLGTFDSIFNVLLIFGGFLVAFFMGWVVPSKFNEELNVSKVGLKTTRYLKFMTKWVSPPIIAFGLVISIFDLLKGWVS